MRRLSIRLRLALVAALVTGLVLLGAGALVLQLLDRRLDGVVDDALAAELQAVGSAATSGGAAAAVQAVATSGPVPERRPVVQVLAPDGSILAGSTTTPLLDASQVTTLLGTVPGGGGGSGVSPVAGGPAAARAEAVTLPGGRRAVVVVASSLTPNRVAVHQARELLLLAWVPASLLAGAGGWVLAGAALRPVEQLRRRAERLGLDGLDGLDGLESAAAAAPAAPTGHELQRLADTFEALLVRLRDALRDRQEQYVAIAHELRTPVSALRAELELLAWEQQASGQVAEESLAAARRGVEHLTVLVERQLLLAAWDHRATLLQLVVVEPDALLEEVREAHRLAARSAGVTLSVLPVPPDLPPLVCDRTRVRQALGNLVDNALGLVPAGGRVELAADRPATPDGEPGPELRLAVCDTGPGFGHQDPRLLLSAFERRAGGRRGADTGLGLGLAIVDLVARAHGGDVEIGDVADSGGGARVAVRLPIAGPAGSA